MSLVDKVSAGAERAVKEAEKVYEKGKAKVGELQIEMQMDGQAKKLGYLVFDFYRGREVDQDQRQKYLDEMTRLEDQLAKARAEAAARKQGGTADAATGAAGATGWASAAGADADAPPRPAPSYPPVPPTEPDCNVPASASDAAKQSAEETFKDDGAWPRGDA